MIIVFLLSTWIQPWKIHTVLISVEKMGHFSRKCLEKSHMKTWQGGNEHTGTCLGFPEHMVPLHPLIDWCFTSFPMTPHWFRKPHAHGFHWFQVWPLSVTMIIHGHATGTDWLEVPSICKAYCLAYVRDSPHNIWLEKWYSTSILGSWICRSWLVVWNMFYFSIQLGIIIPTDEYVFQRVETTNQIHMSKYIQVPFGHLGGFSFQTQMKIYQDLLPSGND